MADRFKTFAELARHTRDGVHWRVTARQRQSRILVAAPHAGRAEPHTGTIAKAVAGATHSLYLFETLGAGLHVTSHRFQEPRGMAQARRHSRVLTIHGCDNERSTSIDVFVGGLDVGLRDAVILESAICRIWRGGRPSHAGEGHHEHLQPWVVRRRSATGDQSPATKPFGKAQEPGTPAEVRQISSLRCRADAGQEARQTAWASTSRRD